MTTKYQLSAPSSGFVDTLLAEVPTQETLYHLVVRIAEVTPIGSDTARHDTDDSILTIPVPLGELDYFGVQRLRSMAAGLMVGRYRSVTFDLSVVAFCDSSIGSFMDWVYGLEGETDVKVITSPAIECVLGLLAGAH